MKNISKYLISYTIEHSKFEEKRNYVSLSNSIKTAEELFNDYVNGYSTNETGKLKCYKGYQMENDMITRLIALYGERIETNCEISVFDGIVQGHPDLKLFGIYGDIKSVLKDEWIPNGRLPRKVYYQMQGYMHYSGTKESIVIYESRESGLIADFIVKENIAVQDEIRRKMYQVFTMIQKYKR